MGKNKKELTEHQKRVFEWLKDYIEENGVSPSLRDLARAFKIAPPSALALLRTLEKKGFIIRDKYRARSIRIKENQQRTFSVPLLGRVPAGKPVEVFEYTEDYITLPDKIKKGKKLFALRVYGESMIGAGIFPGDIVVVSQQNTASHNDIVVVRLEEEVTLKRWVVKKGKVFLKPENPEMEAMEITSKECIVLGKVIELIRFYK